MEAFYKALMAHRIHQDHLMWSRAQTLSAIQVAAFAASWSIKDLNLLAALIMLISFVLTLIIFGLACKDDKDSKVNQWLMDVIGRNLVMSWGIPLPPNVDANIPVKFSSDYKIPILKTGNRAFSAIFITFSVLNILMVIVYLFYLWEWLHVQCYKVI